MTAELVIYDGNCNLCVTLVQLLEQLDGGQRFQYAPMQDPATLQQFSITAQDCELGMILLNPDQPTERWKGSTAAEEIGRRLPLGEVFIQAYRALPGMKPLGDRVYEQVRDHRYEWFGQRDRTYQSAHGFCQTKTCPDLKAERQTNHS